MSMMTEEERLRQEATVQAKPLLKEKVDQIQELSKKEKKQIKKNLDSPKKVKQASSDLGLRSGKVSDKFTEALTFFAPQIVGGAIGALFEGTEGAVAGADMGAQARDSYINHLRQEKELTLQEQKAAQSLMPKQKSFQQADMLFTKEGKPLVFDPNSGSYMTAEGNKVGSDDIRSLQVDAEGRRQLVANVDIMKSKQLSDKQVETVKGFNTSLKAMDRANQLKQGINTGPFAGRAQGAAAIFGQASDEFVQMRTELENAKAEFLKAMSGAQVSEQEARRLSNIIPNVNDDEPTFKAKMTAFNNILNRHRDSVAQSIASRQPLRKEVLNDMLSEAASAGIDIRPQADDSEVRATQIKAKIESRTPEQNQQRLEMLRRKYGRNR